MKDKGKKAEIKIEFRDSDSEEEIDYTRKPRRLLQSADDPRPGNITILLSLTQTRNW